MKYILKNSSWAAIVFLIATIFSCRKDKGTQKNAEIHHLGFLSEKLIKVNEAVTVYDSTAIISPDNNCYTLGGRSQHGIADIIFKCAGTYRVHAQIYDSLTAAFLGNTDTVQIKVTTDTLRPYQLIQPDDTLVFSASPVQSGQVPDTAYETYVQLIFSTTKMYDYTNTSHFNYTSNISANNYALAFSDTLLLDSYPFEWGNGIKSKVDGFIDLHGLTIGMPANISYIWLGQTHKGTITLLNVHWVSLYWNN
jgi:hypothetical protein